MSVPEDEHRLILGMLEGTDALIKEVVEKERRRCAKAAGDFLRDVLDQPTFAAEVERAVRTRWKQGDGPLDMSKPEVTR